MRTQLTEQLGKVLTSGLSRYLRENGGWNKVYCAGVAVNRKPLEIAPPPVKCGGTDVRDLEQAISVSVPVAQ